ncbi:hypothetical protein Tco_0097948 [Tanacetum coccineum]
MSITKEQQQALDDALVLREQRLMIGSCNFRLSTTFKTKEPTFQVALDVLTLTPFYPAFLITASVLKFVDPPFEEEILTFIRELGYPGNIKLLFDVKVDTLPQPWRTFGTIINKCLSGKVTGIDTHRLSRARILWGLYHQEKLDYVYLLWEDLVFQIENKESRKNKYMFYPRFTKVIINHFMSQDQSIPRRNKVDWHMAIDDPILTTMRFIPQHEVVQRYGAILPDYLTNLAMKNLKTDEAPKPSSGKRVKAMAKVAKSGKKKQPTFRLETLSDIALSEAEQMKLAIERSEAQNPSFGKRVKATAKVEKSGKKKQLALRLETLSKIALTEAEQLKLAAKRSLIQTHISHASGSGSDEEDDDDEGKDKDDDNHDNDDEVQGKNIEEEEIDEEATHDEDEANVLYKDVNNHMKGRDTEMTDAPCTIMFRSPLLPLVFAITLPPPPTPLITHMQQTPFLIPTIAPSTSLYDLPNFGSLFRFDNRLKALERDFSKFNQTNQFAKAISSIPRIVDNYLSSKLKDTVDAAVQLKSDRIQEETQADNQDFINQIDENLKKIIKEKVNAQVKKKVSKILPSN